MQGELDAWLDAASGTDEEFVERAWRLVVRRAVDPEAKERALAQLARRDAVPRRGCCGSSSRATSSRRWRCSTARSPSPRGERARPRDVRGPARPRELSAPASSDERAIEIPWCLARYDGEAAGARPRLRLRRAGVSRRADGARRGRSSSASISREKPVPGLRSVVADARELPFADGSFDLVLCVSTLEHVGRDNDVYDVDGAARRHAATRPRCASCTACSRPRAGCSSACRPASTTTRAGRCSARWTTGSRCSSGAASSSSRTSCTSTARTAGGARLPPRCAASATARAGPGAGAVLLAELRPRSIGARLRLVVRDAKHRDEPRRSTTLL